MFSSKPIHSKFLPGNLNGSPAISGSGGNRWAPNANGWKPVCRIFDLGSRGPSTVTLIAFVYVVISAGIVDMHIESVKLFPANRKRKRKREKEIRWKSLSCIKIQNVFLIRKCFIHMMCLWYPIHTYFQKIGSKFSIHKFLLMLSRLINY